MSGSPDRLVLVGFMGAGKSTVGRLLAARLGWEFVDLDGEVERREGTSVSRIFALHGLRAFRRAERLAAAALVERRRCVLATGGGAWAQPATRALLAPGACVVWLEAEFETLWQRVLTQPGPVRPLATSRARMRRLFRTRRQAYASADVRVSAAPGPEAVATAVLAALELSAVTVPGPARGGSDAKR